MLPNIRTSAIFAAAALLHLAHSCNDTDANSTLTILPASAPAPPCKTAYVAELRQMNSYYPNTTYSPTTYFALIRQPNDSIQLATQIQFQGLPSASNLSNSSTSHSTACRLELLLPAVSLTAIAGPDLLINIWNVEREPGSPASWNTFCGLGQASLWGTVNANSQAFDIARNTTGGVVNVGQTECRETLTFQLGFARAPFVVADGQVQGVHYWDFINVVPPASPVQGWRVVYGC